MSIKEMITKDEQVMLKHILSTSTIRKRGIVRRRYNLISLELNLTHAVRTKQVHKRANYLFQTRRNDKLAKLRCYTFTDYTD